MTTTLTGSQLSASTFGLSWVSDAVPAARWNVSLTAPELLVSYLYDPDARAFVWILTDDIVDGLAEGDTVSFEVEAEGVAGESDTLDIIYSTTVPNPLYTAPRYTTVAEVKERLRIPAANVELDDRVEQAVIAAEYGIDAELGQSFPNSTIAGVPVTIVKAATSIAMQIYKADDAPTGTAGGDSFYGELDISDLVRRELQSNPLLKGLRVSWGAA